MKFNAGDRVVHPKRVEWGVGTVRQTNRIDHEGKPAQRVTIDFPNRGRVVINTGVVPLGLREAADPAASSTVKRSPRTRPVYDTIPSNGKVSTAANTPTPSPTKSPVPAGLAAAEESEAQADKGWLNTLETGDTHELWGLPERLSDPFLSLADRIKLTLEMYRYSTEPKALIDWAIAQTGLDDPLTRYTRQEMEQAFPRFARSRDQHLKDLVRQLKREGKPEQLKNARRGAKFAAAQSAFDRAMR
ncbi:MAG: DUF3553 domain-containing protein [Planctomycetota bacterium]